MPSGSKWKFYLLWVLCSGLAAAAVTIGARPAANATGYAVGGVAGYVAGETALGAVALGTFLATIGAGQWLVLSRYVAWADSWLLSHLVNGVIGGALMLGVFAALGGEGRATAPVVGVIVGLSGFGLGQWLLLRRRASSPGWLALAAVAALVAAAPGSAAIGLLTSTELGAGLGFGLAYGAVSGVAVARGLDRELTRSEAG